MIDSPSRPPLPATIRRRWARRLLALLQGVGFWTAVVLPFVYLPLLAVGPSRPLVLVGALGLNAAALLLGHGYDGGPFAPSSDRRTGA